MIYKKTIDVIPGLLSSSVWCLESQLQCTGSG